MSKRICYSPLKRGMGLTWLDKLGKLLCPLVSVRVQPPGDVVFRDEDHGLTVVQPLEVFAGRGSDDAERP